MDDKGFKSWLENRGLTKANTSTRLGAIRRVERVLPALGIEQSDLDAAFDHDRLQATRDALQKLKQNADQGGQDYRILLPESEVPALRLANFISWLGNYREFKENPGGRASDADRIREHVLDEYVAPARERGDPSITVSVRDVHNALGLNQAWANVCQSLEGKKFQNFADVPAPTRQGAERSSATRYTFDLKMTAFSVEAVERVLVRRFGEPVEDKKRLAVFRLANGWRIALDRDQPPAELWIRPFRPIPEKLNSSVFSVVREIETILPANLLENLATLSWPQQIARIDIKSFDDLSHLLDWYEASGLQLDRERLESYRRTFLEHYPDFAARTFRADTGGYFSEERAYKNALLELAQRALSDLENADDSELGSRLLDIVTGMSGAASNLLGWRTNNRIGELRAHHPGVLERETGQLARAGDLVAAIGAFNEVIWPLLAEGQPDLPYSESRSIPTMLAALVHPARACGINTGPMSHFAKALTGQALFSGNSLTSVEYENVLDLVESVRTVMIRDWQWSPRDLWDVQGFIWVVGRSEAIGEGDEHEGIEPMADPVTESTSPTNLILYGPPGTGKTYMSAREAVRLCNGTVANKPDDWMAEYRRLSEAGRIEFVTFHQSFSYEEFVEGLRPVRGDNEVAGLGLAPEPGVFRRIARRAETSTGSGSGDGIEIADRNVFKMSVGEAANPDDAYLFEEALAGGYLLLGFDDIDWSDPRYESRDEIIDACRQNAEDDEAARKISAYSGRVQSPHLLRNEMQNDDLVIVSKGNSLFRAIGVITGSYKYVARENDDYCHRRPVDWLWYDREGVSVEEIYGKSFTMRSIHRLDRTELNIPALERYIASQRGTGSGRLEQFVLVIDEINRANISKVFGELITLLEPDKRLGATNALKVRLPYSGDRFGVPANLHVIGTMNTADRSIALLDTALRRRFEFRELMPDPGALSSASAACGVDLAHMLDMINRRIEYLFDREHQIGHAYFMGCTTRDEVDKVMRLKVIPLLAEYFYEDWSKVAGVLGDARGAGHFLHREELPAPEGLDLEGNTETRYRWSVKQTFGEACYEQLR